MGYFLKFMTMAADNSRNMETAGEKIKPAALLHLDVIYFKSSYALKNFSFGFTEKNIVIKRLPISR